MISARSVLTEAAVAGVFAFGLVVSRRLGRRWTWAEVCVMVLMGLLFELVTARMWTYHHVFILLPTFIDSDISALFPVGWAGLVMAATSCAERAWARKGVVHPLGRHLVLMLCWLAFGAVTEAVFYRIGMIEYVDIPGRRLLLGQLPGLPPTVYMAGYSIIPPAFSQFLLWLERGLRPQASNL